MKYEQPIMDIIVFGVEDVIVTSQIQDSTWDPDRENEKIDGDGF